MLKFRFIRRLKKYIKKKLLNVRRKNARKYFVGQHSNIYDKIVVVYKNSKWGVCNGRVRHVYQVGIVVFTGCHSLSKDGFWKFSGMNTLLPFNSRREAISVLKTVEGKKIKFVDSDDYDLIIL